MARSAVQVSTEEDLARHNGRHLVQVDGRYVALIAHAGDLHALDATCYHMGGPLLHADIEDSAEFGPCVVCPWHRYPISLTTGDSLYRNMQGVSCSKGVKQRVHEVERRGGKIYVRLRAGEVDGAPVKVESDTYAFKPPPPSGGGGIGGAGGAAKQKSVMSGGVVRSGQVLQRGGTAPRTAGANWLARGGGAGSAAQSQFAGMVGKDLARSMCGADGRAPWASSGASVSAGHFAAPIPSGFQSFTLQSRRPIAPDTVELTVSGDLPGPASAWTSGAHLMVRLSSRSEAAERPYTPYRRPGDRGQFQLLVKSYPTGELSPQLAHLAPGAKLLLRGPLSGAPHIEHTASRPLAFVTGGTGITPALQVLFKMADARAAARLAGATMKLPAIHMLCFGRRPEDLYLRSELEALTKELTELILYFSVTNIEGPGAAQWVGGLGRPSADVLRKHLPSADSHARAFWCGPPPFNDVVREILSAIGYTDEQMHEFS
jgi:NAD(P)H-flavin reductase/nitrite reductase/ring-hydroxylating ferredoxin subunit